MPIFNGSSAHADAPEAAEAMIAADARALKRIFISPLPSLVHPIRCERALDGGFLQSSGG
jgi:hypothetical protein